MLFPSNLKPVISVVLVWLSAAHEDSTTIGTLPPLPAIGGGTLFNGDPASMDSVDTSVLGFMHIPKCSGSSFHKKLCELTKGSSSTRSPGLSLSWFNSCKKNSFNSHGCQNWSKWGGTHCGFHEMQDCLLSNRAHTHISNKFRKVQIPAGKRPMFVTILRDPVERVISEFFWWRAAKGQFCKATVWGACLCNAARQGLDTWIESPCNMAHNRQIRYFLMDGVKAPINRQGHQHCAAFFLKPTVVYWEQRLNHSFDKDLVEYMNNDHSLVQAAITVLEQEFWFVGIQEDYEGSQKLFSALYELVYGRKPGKSISKSRFHASKRGSVTDDQRRAIADRNRLDLQLYHYVWVRFIQASARYLGPQEQMQRANITAGIGLQ